MHFSYTLTKEDVVIVISNSGASKELVALLEIANEKTGNKPISITNHENSPVANKKQISYKYFNKRENLFLDEFSFFLEYRLWLL
ncbi:fructoselysine-6-P-deglycase FrlB-like protein [Clostridium beijerinckii]|nr:SIS domain-containing protein [Clostridium beijerinckii]NRZ17615.1 fructoselysine-6-P-deglycase FrlB-like protein [Clostridium beijerinckii]